MRNLQETTNGGATQAPFHFKDIKLPGWRKRPRNDLQNAEIFEKFRTWLATETKRAKGQFWTITTRELAKRFAVAPSTVSRWRAKLVKAGELETRMNGRQLFFRTISEGGWHQRVVDW